MKILLISGHGAGDSGAIGNGLKEAELTRAATYLLEGKLKAYDCTVTRYPTSRNAYEDNVAGRAMNWGSYGLVVEVHFNKSAGGHGVEVLYRNQESLAGKVSSAIASAAGVTNRGAKKRTDLKNMNSCYAAGVPYILIETCFIDSASDVKAYNDHKDAVWTAVCSAIMAFYGIKKKASVGGDAVKNGWKKEGGYWYYYERGAKVKDAWRKDSTGKWCYLSADGKMLTNGWAKDSKGWYYMGGDGYMLKSKWKQYKGYWYYLTADGLMATGRYSVPHTFDSEGRCKK